VEDKNISNIVGPRAPVICIGFPPHVPLPFLEKTVSALAGVNTWHGQFYTLNYGRVTLL
jgi:hypothetical protein